jgi:ATP-dependent exoDNAse (exonuclease V) beta subunit
MVVGDGMQSIYGFRGANVGLFLKARLEGFNGVLLEPLALQCNFRSVAGVVDWVNANFAGAFPAEDDINRGRVRYTAATAVRAPATGPAVSLHAFHGNDAVAQEIEYVCTQIAAACADPGGGSIAVLGRSRGHLQPVLAGLQRLGIAYSAQAMDSLADSAVATDLLSLCRALANRADRLAWMALLRAPWCGLVLADLLVIGRWGEHSRYTPLLSVLADPQLLKALSADGRERLETVLPVLENACNKRDRLGLRAWVERSWLDLCGPATAAGEPDLVNAERFFQLLEQAEREGLGLDTAWLTQRLEKQYVDGGVPGARVQVMTLHKAKGLEFDHVIIPQLARPPRPEGRQLLLWDEHSDAHNRRSFLLAADDHSEPGEPTLYNYLHQQRQEKSLLESTRLLYVGATRAVQQLLLTASLRMDEKSGELCAPTRRSLLSPIWESVSAQITVHEPLAGSDEPDPAAAAVRPLVRLSSIASPFERCAERRAERRASAPGQGANQPVRAANFQQRCVGTVVHLALDELSRLQELPTAIDRASSERWRHALAALGLWGADLEEACIAVQASLATTLEEGGRGRWILSSEHRAARSEWALTCVDASAGIKDLVIDRCFVDAASGERWLIDYKNSQPEPDQSFECFLATQEEAYREQLLRYRAALREIATEPLRCALYFTALGHFHHLAELDLPAREA